MHSINIFSLCANYKSTPEQAVDYLQTKQVQMRSYEFNDLMIFVDYIFPNLLEPKLQYLDYYYVGYTINQIHKEFDLLRFGDNYNINIELKSENTGGNIKDQLLKNRYYLQFLEQETYYFTFVSSEKILYQLVGEQIIVCPIECFIEILMTQVSKQLKSIDAVFDPTNYLVSPFNSTKRFVAQEYFLTIQQQKIKVDITKNFLENNSKVFTIEGNPGTGKTLLTYDIYRHFLNLQKKALIIHCGKLNRGQYDLIIDYNWNIKAIKNMPYDLSEFDVVIVDEAQRIHKWQLLKILEQTESSNMRAIFSYDPQQYLATWEHSKEKIEILIQKTSTQDQYALTHKVRSNKELASFIKYMFYPLQYIKTEGLNYNNVTLHQFSSEADAKYFVKYLMDNNWNCINYTSSRYTACSFDSLLIDFQEQVVGNAHEVIGQEFDNIAVLIDNYFYYENNEMKYRGDSYYSAEKMLFQMITRVRKKLSIIFVNNTEIYQRCIEIIGTGIR